MGKSMQSKVLSGLRERRNKSEQKENIALAKPLVSGPVWSESGPRRFPTRQPALLDRDDLAPKMR